MTDYESGGIRSAIPPYKLHLLHRQCVPGGERVHVVSPVRDFPVFNPDDRAEPIVVFSARREDLSVDLVFDDGETTVVCLVDYQSISGLKRDVVDIAPELGDQVSAPLDHGRPA